MTSDKNMKIFEKFFKKDENKENNMIKRHVKTSTIKNLVTGDIEAKYEFGFNFIDGNKKKKALVWIDNEIVMLSDGQCCIFTIESDNMKSFRIKAVPDFKIEGCNTTACFDPKVEDSDI